MKERLATSALNFSSVCSADSLAVVGIKERERKEQLRFFFFG